MALRPCLGSTLHPYGHTLTPRSRCTECTGHGYGHAWRKLIAAAIALQVQQHGHAWCADCGHTGDMTNPLSGDHLRWPARTTADVEVVCRSCNSGRGVAGR